ncbi:hypothetical protein M5689_009856 [Euphorbia peplus]|nr:hypothetical protein M5689_009856 [Euphorbia peplus]
MNSDITSEKPHFPATEKPQYPVKDPNPTFTKVIRNLTFGESCFITGQAEVLAFDAYCFTVKRGAGVWDRGTTFITASLDTEYIKIYPVIHPNPPTAKVLCNFNFHDYRTITAYTGFSAYYAYLVHRCFVPKFKASPVLVGFLGLLGGLSCAHHVSEGRLKGFFPNNGEVAKYQKQGFRN